MHGGAGSHCGTRLSRGQGVASLLYRTKHGDGALGGAGGLAIVHADYSRSNNSSNSNEGTASFGSYTMFSTVRYVCMYSIYIYM